MTCYAWSNFPCILPRSQAEWIWTAAICPIHLTLATIGDSGTGFECLQRPHFGKVRNWTILSRLLVILIRHGRFQLFRLVIMIVKKWVKLYRIDNYTSCKPNLKIILFIKFHNHYHLEMDWLTADFLMLLSKILQLQRSFEHGGTYIVLYLLMTRGLVIFRLIRSSAILSLVVRQTRVT